MSFPSSAAPPATRPQAAPERAVNDPMVTFEGVTKTFGGTSGKPGFAALAGIDYVVPKGSITGIIGRSGAGKSTLIRLANGLEKPSSGRVVVDGVDVAALDEKSLRTLRRSVGMIFQHFNLLSSRTAFDNVALPLEISGMGKGKSRPALDRCLISSGSPTRRGVIRPNSPVARSSVSALPARSQPSRSCSSPTRRPRRLIRRRHSPFSNSSSASMPNLA